MSISIPEKINVQSVSSFPVTEPEIKEAVSASLQGGQHPPEPPVTISGRGLMMSRLFSGHAVEPATVQYDPELTALLPTLFLFPEDRDLLSAVYEFVNEEGPTLVMWTLLLGPLLITGEQTMDAKSSLSGLLTGSTSKGTKFLTLSMRIAPGLPIEY
jgi:hypothetical protein